MVRLGITRLAMIVLGSRSMVLCEATFQSFVSMRSVGHFLSSFSMKQDWIVGYFVLRVDLDCIGCLAPELEPDGRKLLL